MPAENDENDEAPPLKFGIRLIQGQQKAAIQYRADAVEDQVSVITSE